MVKNGDITNVCVSKGNIRIGSDTKTKVTYCFLCLHTRLSRHHFVTR